MTVVAVVVGIIIVLVFGFFVIIIENNVMATTKASLVIVIFGVVFGCSIKVRLASGEGTVIICLRKKMMIVAFEIIINVVFGM